MFNTKELMHCLCGTNNRAPRLTFMDPCRPEMRPGAPEESASPAWLAKFHLKIYMHDSDNERKLNPKGQNDGMTERGNTICPAIS